MPDNHSPEVRSYNMSRIRARNTVPEEIVCKYLFSKGFRYRKNDKRYPGKPDIVLPRYRTIIFVHGCFWHSHNGCPDYVVPKLNADYWIPKLERNRQRDVDNTNALRTAGWRVIIVWECELKPSVREERLTRLLEEIAT